MRRLLILAVASAVACSEPTESILPSITGQWSGTVPPAPPIGAVLATATITQNGNALTGTGSVGNVTALPLTGTISLNGEITFSLRTNDTPPRFIFFSGDLYTPSRMDGQLQNWYDAPVSLTLMKQ